MLALEIIEYIVIGLLFAMVAFDLCVNIPRLVKKKPILNSFGFNIAFLLLCIVQSIVLFILLTAS